MGHTHQCMIKHLAKNTEGGPNQTTKAPPETCEGWEKGKSKTLHFLTCRSRAKWPLDLVHSDMDKMPVLSIGRYKYTTTYLDYHSSFGVMFYLKNKSEEFAAFNAYKAWVEWWLGTTSKWRWFDQREFVSNKQKEYMKDNWIEYQMSTPDSLQKNGWAERFQQTVINGAEAMQCHAVSSNGFWIYTVKAKIHTHNVTPIKWAGYNTLRELWDGIKLDILHLRVFGCLSWVHGTMGVWKLVDFPDNCKTINCRWTYMLKSDGHYKARLIVKGYSQVQGIDYEETFSPVARYKSNQYLLLDWEIEAMDIKLVYLHGVLKEEIYMEKPEGFIAKGEDDKVWKLMCSLYRLKQAGQVCNRTFENTIKRNLCFDTIHSDVGVCVLCCHHKGGFWNRYDAHFICQWLIQTNPISSGNQGDTGMTRKWWPEQIWLTPCDIQFSWTEIVLSNLLTYVYQESSFRHCEIIFCNSVKSVIRNYQCSAILRWVLSLPIINL